MTHLPALLAQDNPETPANDAAAAPQPFQSDVGGFIMPDAASTYADKVDWTFYFILGVSTFFFLLIGTLLVYFAFRYRQRDKDATPHGQTHNTALELGWSIIPGILLIVMFISGFRGYLDMATPPEGAYPVTVRAWQWGWDFTHPGGEVDPDLHVPADTPILLTLTSDDVIHSLFIPQFRTKKDVVPGRFNQTWFEAPWNPDRVKRQELEDLEGNKYTLEYNEYDLFCTEYCGKDHANMNRKVKVYTPESFRIWLRFANDPTTETPLAYGMKVYRAKCASCHSLDGTTGTGPTWKDLWDHPSHELVSGMIQVDQEYIVESIVNPQAKVTKGYPRNGMAPWYLTDAEMIGIFQVMKVNSDYYKGSIYQDKEDWKKLLGIEEETPETGGDAATQPANP